MRLLLASLLIIGFHFIGTAQNRWKKERVELPVTKCYASDQTHLSYTGMPAEYYQRLKLALLKTADIEVTYVGFSGEAQQAFQYAVDIWKNMIYSPVPIRIKATWKSLERGVLGSCGPSGFYKNFDATQKWDTYYPIALVEKMTGEEVNDASQYDLVAEFNRDFGNWYLGIDGQTPARQYDFVSVVLHELTHGLGFTGILYSEGGKGGYHYGDDLLPAIFDRHIINKNQQFLVNKTLFPNPSVTMNLALTSGWLEFYTTLSGNMLPRLYAPATFDEGSSLYHLDDNTYPAGNPNSLMTPFTGMGEAIHHPGQDALSIMYEMGWKSVSIRHNALKDREASASPIDFNALIESDNDLDMSKLYLVYSTNRFVKTDSVLLTFTGTPGSFSVNLSQFKNGEVNYYFAATDISGRRYVYPSNAPKRYLSFRIGTDRQLPVVKHEPVRYLLSSYPSAKIEASVTDNLGIRSVNVEYFVNGGAMQRTELQHLSGDIYSGVLSLPAGSVKGGERVSYRIIATDASMQSNLGSQPMSGYNSLVVETIKAPGEKYHNDFNAVTSDFIGSEFFISTPNGFDSRALNSSHPYASPDTDNMEYNFTSILRNPIILKPGGVMSYDEIVMVEPADSGVKFGDEEFWDYVIVEGSKDGGNTWLPLLEGYDSNEEQSWLDLYNNSFSGNNSTAVPGKELYVKREFQLLGNGNFAAGDTILIRFRLFSDPYSNGWGWIIDNLSIQDITSGITARKLSAGEVMFYPNPVSDQLTIDIQSDQNLDQVVLKAYNASGALVYNQQLSVGSKDFITRVDVRNFTPGLYLWTVETEKAGKISRKVLIQ